MRFEREKIVRIGHDEHQEVSMYNAFVNWSGQEGIEHFA